MKQVYVQNLDGEPLMPTTRQGAVRRWLRDEKAIVVNLCPFTIRLNWDTDKNTQEIVVGLDTGAVNVGCGAVSENSVLYASETKLRTDISKKMQRRAMYRRTRRCRKLRYRQPRFNNRTRPDGWLPPSLKSKVESTIKIVKKLSEILPIKKVIVEIAKFDTQKLQSPDIEGVQYQQGQMEGYDNVRAYVFERDKYTCQICKKKLGILQTHHIIQRKDNGSDRPDNMVAVHKTCHEDYHKGLIKHKFRKPKEYKQATQVTILKDFIVNELRKDFNIEITFGHITKRNRMRLNLPKSHWADGIAITNPKIISRVEKIIKQVCITQRRYQMTKGIRSEKKLPSGQIFGFNQWDKVRLLDKRVGFIKGRRLRGDFEICDIDNNKFEKSFKYTTLNKLSSTNVMGVEAIPPTLKSVGSLA